MIVLVIAVIAVILIPPAFIAWRADRTCPTCHRRFPTSDDTYRHINRSHRS